MFDRKRTKVSVRRDLSSASTYNLVAIIVSAIFTTIAAGLSVDIKAGWRAATARKPKEASAESPDGVIAAEDTADVVAAADPAPASLQESDQRFRAIFSSVNDGIIIHDMATAAFTDVNAQLCELFGYSREELLGRHLADLSAADAGLAGEELAEPLRRVAAQGAAAFEWRCRAKDGRPFWLEMSMRRAAFGDRDVLLSTARDITERKRADAHIARLARYDQLTDLPNRELFVETLNQRIGQARVGTGRVAVLYLDLDHFTDVNDTLGHPVGDLLLKAAAQRLSESLGGPEKVARFSGAEFAVIVGADTPSPHPPTDAETSAATTNAAIGMAETLLRRLGEPFIIQGHVVRTSATIGIAVEGDDAANAERLLSRADVALRQAKSGLRGAWRLFTASMETEVRARVRMGLELSDAIASDQLMLMYQPQVDIETGRIVGLEALARWRHPTRGLLTAGDFVPAAELNGLIAPLGQWVLREACRQTRQWIDAGLEPMPVAVNVSAMQFKLRRELGDDIAESLAEFSLPASLLELELTESVLMDASTAHDDLVSQLRERGHRIAIDDFGSGYSSLDYLRRYPADRIKIDRHFIADIGASRGADAIVSLVLDLGRALAIEVVAEGVETEAQLKVLKTCGARIAQGFYFARPLAVQDVTGCLETRTIDLSAVAEAGQRSLSM
jgi:diguanylate cyclase (GGDEF)-like protein/PAS domain S-box-containing protein